MMQKLTTREPSDDMVEVAMASLAKVLSLESREDGDEDAEKSVI